VSEARFLLLIVLLIVGLWAYMGWIERIARRRLNVKQALDAIASFPNETPLHDYLSANGVVFNELEPPYLKMAKVAIHAIGDYERLPKPE
jgi:hypothetical protein